MWGVGKNVITQLKGPWKGNLLTSSTNRFNILQRAKHTVPKKPTKSRKTQKDLQPEEKPHVPEINAVKTKGQFTFNKKDLDSKEGLMMVYEKWKKHYRKSQKAIVKRKPLAVFLDS